MSVIDLLPEKLGPLGSQMYKLLLSLNYREDYLLTITPPPGKKSSTQWIIDNWNIVTSAYEKQCSDPLYWAFIGTDDWSQTRTSFCGSGHIIFPADHMPKQYTLLKSMWKDTKGDWKSTGHDSRRKYNRSKVGYWCQHLDTDNYIVEFASSVLL